MLLWVRLLDRIIKADPERPTRFHDLRGRRIDVSSLPLIPLAVIDTALDVGLGYRRCVPWISYRATRQLQHLIRPHWRILEFGSGMSTIWFARRANFVFSVESDHRWHQRVREMLAQRGLANVHLEYRSGGCAEYSSIDGLEDDSFDLALIDGACRDDCVQPCLAKVKAGGYVYLDNTDQPGDRQIAEAKLLSAAPSWARYYNDFAPGLVAITQGLLVRIPA